MTDRLLSGNVSESQLVNLNLPKANSRRETMKLKKPIQTIFIVSSIIVKVAIQNIVFIDKFEA